MRLVLTAIEVESNVAAYKWPLFCFLVLISVRRCGRGGGGGGCGIGYNTYQHSKTYKGLINDGCL